MVSSEIKMRVAQNCHGYHPRYLYSSMSLGSSSQSCSNCANYVRGKCRKDLFDEISNAIRLN